jgi:hypothetical protein
MDYVTVSSKIDRLTYAQLKHYCDNEKITPSLFIKKLVESNVSNLIPLNKAGINKFSYDKASDSFFWSIEFDDGEEIVVGENLSSEFLENLTSQLGSEISTRNSYLKKTKKQSVIVPIGIKKMKGVKKHAKR